MTNCDYCGKIDEYPKGYNRNFCDNCIKDKEIGIPFAIDKINLKGYGDVSLSRLKELESQVMLPINRKDGGDYYVGKRLDSGKIAEKMPDFRP